LKGVLNENLTLEKDKQLDSMKTGNSNKVPLYLGKKKGGELRENKVILKSHGGDERQKKGKLIHRDGQAGNQANVEGRKRENREKRKGPTLLTKKRICPVSEGGLRRARRHRLEKTC